MFAITNIRFIDQYDLGALDRLSSLENLVLINLSITLKLENTTIHMVSKDNGGNCYG